MAINRQQTQRQSVNTPGGDNARSECPNDQYKCGFEVCHVDDCPYWGGCQTDRCVDQSSDCGPSTCEESGWWTCADGCTCINPMDIDLCPPDPNFGDIEIEPPYIDDEIIYDPEIIPGCTDPEALNYNSNATYDNGTCEYPDPCAGWLDIYPEGFYNGGCNENQLGATLNDTCPNGFICHSDCGEVCCPPGQRVSEGYWDGPNYIRDCLSTDEDNIKYCGDPGAINYNPYAHPDFGNHPGMPDHWTISLYPSNQEDCLYCDPWNDVWTDCTAFCTDWRRWDNNPWQKGDVNNDGTIDVLDIVTTISLVLENTQDLSPGKLACTLWAADVNNDQSMDILDLHDMLIPDELTHPLTVLQINAGHLFNLRDSSEPPTSCDDPRCTDVGIEIEDCCTGWSNGLLSSMEDFDNCSDDCTKQGLCRRVDEEVIFDFINTHQPDIAIITELISNSGIGYSCDDNDCGDVEQNPESSCYEDHTFPDASMHHDPWLPERTEQIHRILPNNYYVSCNNPLYTCIAVRNDIGHFSSEYSHPVNDCVLDDICNNYELPLPHSCKGKTSWPINVGYNYLTLNDRFPIKIISAHPKQGQEFGDDECRREHISQIFEQQICQISVDESEFTKNVPESECLELGGQMIPALYDPEENILVAGDFNLAAHHMDLHHFWTWDSNTPSMQYVADFIRNALDNWETQPTIEMKQRIPTCGEYTFRAWDMSTSVEPNGVDFTITNPEGEEILMGAPNPHASYYDLNINIDWNWFDFRFCADDPWGPSGDMPWQEHCIKIPLFTGCGDCNLNGSCDNSYQVTFQGPMTMVLRYYQTTYECSVSGGDVTCNRENLGDPCGPDNNEDGALDGECEETNLITMSNPNIDNLELVDFNQTLGAGQWMFDQFRDVMGKGMSLALFGWIPFVDIPSHYVYDLDIDMSSILSSISPINYQSIVDPTNSVPDSDYIDSIEYFLQHANNQNWANFTVHNGPYPEPTFKVMALDITLDYILSNFGETDGNCDIYKFPFMDHHALMCTINSPTSTRSTSSAPNDNNGTTSNRKQSQSVDLPGIGKIQLQSFKGVNHYLSNPIKMTEEYFNHIQTSTQNFYFFDIKKLEELNMTPFNRNYYIIAECNKTLVGYRQIGDKNKIIDVPVMGLDDTPGSENYCSHGQTPTFYIYDDENLMRYDLKGTIVSAFTGNNVIHNVNF